MTGLLEIMFDKGVQLEELGSLRVGRGEVLIQQNAISKAIYFVLAGRFRIERDGQTVGHIEAGSVVGEIGFFTGGVRTASVVAFRDSLVLRLTRAQYETYCARLPGLREAIIAELASRLAERYLDHDSLTRDRTRPRTLALIAAGDGALPADFPARLGRALKSLCAATTVTFEGFHAATGGAAPDSLEAVDWFSRNERESDLTLYLPDQDNAAWQRAIIRQSDQVLILGHAGAPPALSPIETFALAQIPVEQRRLLLIHRKRRERVAGSGEWLRGRPVAMHHHLALEDDQDICRLARFLTGTAVGLVLSGGGAYGLAHIGVQRGLAQAGIDFDIYGGTSIGSAMAAAFAMGIEGAELVARIDDIFLKGRALRRVTVPRYALLDHRRLDAKLHAHFSDLDIADMWKPFYAVATDLDTNRLAILRAGPLWQAIRASSALPGILPPFIRSGNSVLVDGGILDNLPYRTMHALKAGPNVVVSLARKEMPTFDYAYDKIPGRLGLLLRSLHPRTRRYWAAPSATETIMRSMTVGRTHETDDLAPGDWLLRPPLPTEMGVLNWNEALSLVAPAETYTAAHTEALSRSDADLYRRLRVAR